MINLLFHLKDITVGLFRLRSVSFHFVSLNVTDKFWLRLNVYLNQGALGVVLNSWMVCLPWLDLG